MSSRRRRRRPIWLWILAVVAVVLLAWWFWSGDEETPKETTITREAPAETAPEIRLDRNRPIETATSDPVGIEPTATPGSEGAETPATVTSPEERITPGPSTRQAPAAASIRNPPTPTGTAIESLQKAAGMLADDPEAARGHLTRAWLAGLDGGSRATATAHARRLADLTLLKNPEPASSAFLRPRKVEPNEFMSMIRQRENLSFSIDFLTTINGLSDPDRLKAGQVLYLPVGEFEGVVDLSSRDLAIFQRIDGRQDLLLVVPIEIGRADETPTGLFRVRTDGRRGRHHRIPLEPRRQEERDGSSEREVELVARTGAGPGDGRSIRLDPADAKLVYELLGASREAAVEIRQ